MRTALTIGREPDNDLVINLPIVSGHHARVTWEGVPGQAVIEDLGSSNGTSIGQLDRKITRSTISASDLIYLGNHPIPGAELLAWVDPSLAPSLLMHGPEMVVGRDPGCHRVIERPTISGRHARLKRSGDRIILEDLGSSNGTFLNGKPVEGPTEVQFGDLIGFGLDSFRLATGSPQVAGTQRMDAIRPGIAPRATPTMQVSPLPSAPSSQATNGWMHPVALLVLVLHAPIVGALIGLISGTVATALFLLSLASLWFGLSTGVVGLLLDPNHPRSGRGPDQVSYWLARLLLLGTLCFGECLLAQLLVVSTGGLSAPAFPMLGLLILASWTGLAVGLLIVLLSARAPIAWAGLGVALVALCLFGGGPWSLPRSAPVVKLASNAAPTRWAFEGLLVSESEVRASKDAGAREGRDMAEDYFPAETDRMGVRADAMALASMFLGLLGVGAFVVRFSENAR